MARSRSAGCLRPLLISFGTIVVLGAGLVAVNWDTFRMIVANMTSMGEGAADANAIRSPDDLLAFVAEHDGASLVAFDVGQEDAGIRYRADVPRPLVHAPKLMLAAAFAERVASGAWDPEERIALAELGAYHLPGHGQDGHLRAVGALRADGVVAGDSLPLEAVARSMVAYNDDAAADYLMERLGRDTVRTLPERWGLEAAEPPLPATGLVLTWHNHTMHSTPEERIDAFAQMSARDLEAQAYDLGGVVRTDAAFRRKEIERLGQAGTDLTLAQQRTLAGLTLPAGTASAYADFMAGVAQGHLAPDTVNVVLQGWLEQPVPVDTSASSLTHLASKGGAFPGIITFVGYARRAHGLPPRVLVVLLDEVPIAVFYHLLQTGIDRGFAAQLLADDAFFERVRTQLMPDQPPASAASR